MALRGYRLREQELVDTLNHRRYLLPLLVLPTPHVVDRARQVFVRGEDLAEPHKRAHGEDIHARGAVALEDGGEHSDPEFREYIWSPAETQLRGGIGHHNL